ncbi:hypothetical protein C8R44DRAFT_868594 [Mycena epipterygia]|nr:hypothetical protein C8R44DRAFT_868594 [Mycena epipterygia]
MTTTALAAADALHDCFYIQRVASVFGFGLALGFIGREVGVKRRLGREDGSTTYSFDSYSSPSHSAPALLPRTMQM